MLMALQVFLLILSLAFLYYGAEFALDSAEKVGKSLGLSPLVIGLVIVGFGTSLPELFVSHLASWRGQYPLALGNIMGSNIANLFLILGVASFLAPLPMGSHDIKVQTFIHLVLTVIMFFVLSLSTLTLISGGFLILFFIGYLNLTYFEMKNEMAIEEIKPTERQALSKMEFLKLNIGFILLYGGGELLVYSGSALGEALGVSPFIISAVFVAFGTSLPELITAVMSCVKKKDLNLITGNILGSNMFNGSLILGSIGIYEVPLSQNFNIEFLLLVLASAVLITLASLRRPMTRMIGVGLLAGYVFMIARWVSVG
jgi:cation:H+ antiporter